MSEKDFDDRIRKKLESLQADYTPEAWEGFRKLLPVPWYVTFLKTYGGWIFGGISSLALLFNLLFNPKPESFEETDTLTVIEEKTPEKEILYSTDTVYKTRIVYKYIYRDRPVDDPVAGRKEMQPAGPGAPEPVPDSALSGVPVLAQLPAYTKEENTVRKPEKAELKKDTLDAVAENKLPATPQQRKFWANFHIRPGVEADYMGNSSFSFGPLAEIFVKNRFSVSTGISISNTSPSSFLVLKEFNLKTGKDFEDQYKPPKSPGPTKDGIKNITVETSRIRMPVYMTYYVPVTYSLNFLISTGTRLDLKVSENVSYTNEGYANSSFISMESVYKPKVFNNLYYGMGLQYRYGRVYGQVAPYFEFPFSKPKYLISSNKFGVNAALKFSLR
ncbi:MAG: hypothetical protein LRY55_11875 [Leadbetterella sp.]|nr:hypothetical protein [Leadbetterella sp.]